jgi:hypothetical protein
MGFAPGVWYSSAECYVQNQSDQMVIYNVAKILEQAVPLMEHPSPNFLTQLEEDMMKLILKQGTMVSFVTVLNYSCAEWNLYSETYFLCTSLWYVLDLAKLCQLLGVCCQQCHTQS